MAQGMRASIGSPATCSEVALPNDRSPASVGIHANGQVLPYARSRTGIASGWFQCAADIARRHAHMPEISVPVSRSSASSIDDRSCTSVGSSLGRIGATDPNRPSSRSPRPSAVQRKQSLRCGGHVRHPATSGPMRRVPERRRSPTRRVRPRFPRIAPIENRLSQCACAAGQ